MAISRSVQASFQQQFDIERVEEWKDAYLDLPRLLRLANDEYAASARAGWWKTSGSGWWKTSTPAPARYGGNINEEEGEAAPLVGDVPTVNTADATAAALIGEGGPEPFFVAKRAVFREQWAEVVASAAQLDTARLAAASPEGKQLRRAAVHVYRNFMLLSAFAQQNRCAVDEVLSVAGSAFDAESLPIGIPLGSGEHGAAAALEMFAPVPESSPKGPTEAGEKRLKDIATSPVQRDVEEVVSFYARHFCGGDQKVAERELSRRRMAPAASQWEVLTMGVGIGAMVPVVVGLAASLSVDPDPDYDAERDLWNVFPLFRGVAVLYITVWLWAGVTQWMREARINYTFILELGEEQVRPMQLARLMALLSALHFYCFVAYISRVRQGTSTFRDQIQMSRQQARRLYLLACALVPLAILLCPFPVLYRPTRMWFMRHLAAIFVTPLFPSTFAHNLLTDYLTSMVKVGIDFWSFFCNLSTGAVWYDRYGDSEDPFSECRDIRWVPDLLTLLPLLWRLLQNLRRIAQSWRDAGTPQLWPHLANAGKYAVSVTAVCVGIQHRDWGHYNDTWNAGRVIYILLLCASTLYSYTWDLMMDWSLFKRDGARGWHWRRTYFSHRTCLLLAAGNLVGRLAWAYTIVAHPPGTPEQTHILILITATVEVVRRSVWCFLRIGNEHFRNVGQYRATAKVPLPFTRGTAPEPQGALPAAARGGAAAAAR